MEHSIPFALRVKDITPFHSEAPNGATLPSAKGENAIKTDPKQSTSAVLDQF
jgi:hypothetical protein